MQTYCIYCKAGQEEKVLLSLRYYGFACMAPMEIERHYVDGTVKKRNKRLLPGYVFFDAEESISDWKQIKDIFGIYKVLEYDDGVRELRNDDLEFTAWLKRQNGLIEISKVVQVGSKIQIISGPLKYYAGKITEVNKRRKVVAVSVGEAGHIRKIWCPVEYVENIT